MDNQITWFKGQGVLSPVSERYIRKRACMLTNPPALILLYKLHVCHTHPNPHSNISLADDFAECVSDQPTHVMQWMYVKHCCFLFSVVSFFFTSLASSPKRISGECSFLFTPLVCVWAHSSLGTRLRTCTSR